MYICVFIYIYMSEDDCNLLACGINYAALNQVFPPLS